MRIKPSLKGAQLKCTESFESIAKEMLGEEVCSELARIFGLAIMGKERISNDRHS
jgi:hypothetical protein